MLSNYSCEFSLVGPPSPCGGPSSPDQAIASPPPPQGFISPMTWGLEGNVIERFTGAGVPPQTVRNFVGIMKAYSTRVGGGPFPTEQDNPTGSYIRERGNEYGTTTRRPRRCGWFDAVAVKYSADLCGTTEIALTLLDVLSGLETVRICVGYKHRGAALDYFRADMDTLAEVEPVYETLPGWRGNLTGCRRFEELPKEAQTYVTTLEKLIGAPIKMLMPASCSACAASSVVGNSATDTRSRMASVTFSSVVSSWLASGTSY